MPGLIPRTFIDDLILRLNIVDVIDDYLTLKKTGTNYSACCPFHQEKTPSFTVSQQKQFFYCFGCGASGNVIGFVMDFERIGFVEAIELLANRLGLSVPHESGQKSTPTDRSELTVMADLLTDISRYYQQQLRSHEKAPQVIDYLKQRGLTGIIAKHYQLGFAPPGWENLARLYANSSAALTSGMLINKSGRIYDRFRERIMFPIHDPRGRVIGFGGRVIDDEQQPKYLNSPETELFHKSHTLYGLYQVLQTHRQPEQMVVVEGYMDVVALAQFGIDYAVATLGTATSGDHIKLLARYTQRIVFCFDGDTAGRSAAWKALQNCLPVLRDKLDIRFMFLPDGEDPDSLIRSQGKEAFVHNLTQAQDLAAFFFTQLQRQTNTSTTAGKAQLLDSASMLLQQIKAPAYLELLLQGLSDYVKMPVAEVEKLCLNRTTATTVKPKVHASLSTMRYAIALLLQNPQLLQQTDINQASLIELKQAGSDLLQQLCTQINNSPHYTTAHLIEHWRDHDYYPLLRQLAYWPINPSCANLATEFSATINQLTKQTQQEQIAALLHKAQTNHLSAIEKKQLQSMILAQKTPP